MLQRASFRYTMGLYILDMAVTVAALYMALLARRNWPLGKAFQEALGGLTLPVVGIVLVVWTVAFFAAGAYSPPRIIRIEHETTRVLAAIAIGALVLAGTLYFSFRGLSRLLVVYFILFDVVLVLSVRVATRLIWRNLGARRLPGSRVLIAGAGVLGRDMAEALKDHAWMGLEIAGFIDDDEAKQGVEFEGFPVLGSLGDCRKIVEEQVITDVLVALPLRAHRRMAEIVAELERLPVNIKVAPDLGPLVSYRMTVEMLGDTPTIGLREPVIRPYQRVMKRALDLVVSSVALILTGPLWAILAIAIKLDSPGPVFYSQERIGEGGTVFKMYKFRSMVQGADKMERSLVESTLNGDREFFKGPHDPRATRIGRFIRRTSIDELPQFWNVLKGDMSLVGPRPELPVLVEHYKPWQRKRFGVPQGLTGWWQVNGRSDRPMYLSTEDDLYYIQNYTLLLDLRILFRTALAVIRGKGAY